MQHHRALMLSLGPSPLDVDLPGNESQAAHVPRSAVLLSSLLVGDYVAYKSDKRSDDSDHGNDSEPLDCLRVLSGFLFAGFWWALNRELTFDPSQRHFKPGYALLILTMILLGTSGSSSRCEG